MSCLLSSLIWVLFEESLRHRGWRRGEHHLHWVQRRSTLARRELAGRYPWSSRLSLGPEESRTLRGRQACDCCCGDARCNGHQRADQMRPRDEPTRSQSLGTVSPVR